MEQETQNTTLAETKENIQQADATKVEAAAPIETQEQINWKKFRETREIERRQKEAAEKRASEKEAEAHALKAAMEAILTKQAPQARQNDYYQDTNELTEDQRIEQKISQAIAARDLQYEAHRKQKEHEEFPTRLRNDLKDFDTVCSSENLDYLQFHYPEVASAFSHAQDGYAKWADVYKAVKRFVPVTDSKREQNKAEKNFNKPQSMSVPGVTQVGDTAPMQLDDKRRADNWARMQKVMKGAR